MKVKDEEREIIFEFKNAEEHKRFVKILKQTRDSICGRSILLCNACPLARIYTKDSADLCEVIDKMFVRCSE